jgi:hypothetical protein
LAGFFAIYGNMDLGHWKLADGLPSEIPEGSLGFIYCITRLSDGKKYVGKKLLWNKTCKKPLKGNKNKRRGLKESDWREYTGSSPILNDYLTKNGKDGFEFTILHFHPSKMTLSYYETKELIERNAIFSTEYWNEVLNCRFRNKKL